MLRVCHLIVTLVLLSIALPRSAGATFHFMSISEIGVDYLSDPNVQFVELRLDLAGQTNLTNTRLTSFDKDGNATLLLLTPSGVANGSNGRNVLYATTEFQTKTGITPDYIIPPGVVSPVGMICWGAPPDGNSNPQDPNNWDLNKPNNYIDCVAYSSYPFERRLNSGAATTLTPGDGVNRSLTRVKNSSVSGSNDTDFVLAIAHPCNNAGDCTFVGPTPIPTPTLQPTASATPDVPPAKAQLACKRAVIKATNKFAAAQVQALVGCDTNLLKGKIAGPCPDAKAAAKIAAADAKRTKAIVKACGALTPSDAGFPAACPGYTGDCTDALGTIEEVSSCVDCGVRRAGDALTAALYAAPPDATQLKCQLALGKTVTSYYRAIAALLAKCEDGVARGKIAAPCPDAKTAPKIAAKSAKLRASVCKACGGKDKLCDGTNDAAPATLGLTACPSVTIPGGTNCGTITIDDLGDVATCAQCLADFESACTTALSAHPATLPADCSAAP